MVLIPVSGTRCAGTRSDAELLYFANRQRFQRRHFRIPMGKSESLDSLRADHSGSKWFILAIELRFRHVGHGYLSGGKQRSMAPVCNIRWLRSEEHTSELQ